LLETEVSTTRGEIIKTYFILSVEGDSPDELTLPVKDSCKVCQQPLVVVVASFDPSFNASQFKSSCLRFRLCREGVVCKVQVVIVPSWCPAFLRTVVECWKSDTNSHRF